MMMLSPFFFYMTVCQNIPLRLLKKKECRYITECLAAPPCSTIPYCNVLYGQSCITGREAVAQPQFRKVLFNPLKLIKAS